VGFDDDKVYWENDSEHDNSNDGESDEPKQRAPKDGSFFQRRFCSRFLAISYGIAFIVLWH
jgi:hypothetical protein